MTRARGSTLVAAGIALSRLAGLARTVVLSVVLGGGAVTDAFTFAMRVPNLLQNLLGEGSLSASFIPVYAKLVEDGRHREADDLAGAVVSLLALATGLIVLAGVLAARPLVWLFTSWESDPAQYELAVRLTRITTIGIGFLVISAWCLGILNSHRRFFLSYVAPVIWNVTQIAVLAALAIAGWTEADIAIGVAWAVVAGGFLQLAVQLPRVRRLVPAARPSLQRSPAVGQVMGRFGPAVGARGVVQVSSYVDLALAGLLAFGALSWYAFALPLYLLPISLFGFSVAAAELAEMSRRSDDSGAVAERLAPALLRVAVPAGLVTAVFVAAGRAVVDVVYGIPSQLFDRGLDDDGLTAVTLVLGAFAIGLPATMSARVTQNTLYSLGDVGGPARIAVVRLVVSAAVSLVLILQLDWLQVLGGEVVRFGDVPHWPPWERVPPDVRADDSVPHLGAVGLGLGSSAAAWIEWYLLRRRLGRRLGGPIGAGAARPVAVAGTAAAGAMFAATVPSLPTLLTAVAVAIAGLGVYGGLLWLQGVRPSGSGRGGRRSMQLSE